MANVTVKINDDEKQAMLKVIAKNDGQTMAVSKLAKQASQNPNRARYVIDELLQEGKITKTVTKTFNERYIRYCYGVVK